jgi:hypothetical protein
MISRRSLLVLLSGTALLPTAQSVAQGAWTNYKNERFGTSIEYPSVRFRSLRPPDNNDGLQFVATDGAGFVVSAIRNIEEETIEQIEASFVQNRGRDSKITYRRRGPNWFVVSGTRGNTIFYHRRLLSHRNELLNSFEIIYPAALKTTYDPIVTRMSRSFRAGVGYDSGPL